ncbi:hypothetical protein Tsubulata_011429, partial [Turnera subulata]
MMAQFQKNLSAFDPSQLLISIPHHHCNCSMAWETGCLLKERIYNICSQGKNAGFKDCLLSALRIGVKCSMEVPQDRMKMVDVITELQKIKATYERSRELFLLLSGIYHLCIISTWKKTICKDKFLKPSYSFRPYGLLCLPHGLYNISSIEQINVRDNRLSGSIPSDRGLTLPRLGNLNIIGNNFTGLIPQTLSNASTFQIIALGGNNLRGPIPKDLGHLPQLAFLVLGENQLVDDLSFINSLTNCSQLFNINLQQNFFTGQIPKNTSKSWKLWKFNFLFSEIMVSVESMAWETRCLLKEMCIAMRALPHQVMELVEHNISSQEENAGFKDCLLSALRIGVRCSMEVPEDRMKMVDVINELKKIKASYERSRVGTSRAIDHQDPFHILSSWNDSVHYCAWPGVSCGRRHPQRVVALTLNSQGLVGSLSPHIGNLSFLRYVDLQNNSLHGHIPQEIGHLFRLRLLLLSENSFVGGIPTNLSRCSNLVYFDLNDNNMLPKGLYNISSIERIVVSSNRLNGRIPSDIGLTLPKLKYLILVNNSFTGLIQRINTLSNASTLVDIDFGNNYFRGPIPKDLGRLPQLKALVFAQNQLEDDLSFINSLTNYSYLHRIDIHQNFLTGQIPKSIANLSSYLRFINLGDNQLRGAIPMEIEYLTGLQWLYLQQNLLSRPIHHINFTRLQRLQHLSVEKNKLSGSIPSTIGNLGALSLLRMSFKSWKLSDGSIPKELLSLRSLSIALDLSSNRLTGSLPVEIGRLPNLGSLNVFDNKLVGIIPDSVIGCSSMEELCLGGNYFAGEIPQALSSLRGLRILDISCNNLSGKIPDFLSRLPGLTLLNLSLNRLQGEVPKRGIFLNESAVSIFGNNDLCGGITELKLPPCLNSKEKKNNIHLIWKVSIPIVSAVHICDPKTVIDLFAEYGMGQRMSTQGDVYSFGIILLEMFTEKRPTNSYFKDGLNLHICVERAFPHQVMELVEPHIFSETKYDSFEDCLLSVLRIGVQWSMELAEDRMKMVDVISELQKIKTAYERKKRRRLIKNEEMLR